MVRLSIFSVLFAVFCCFTSVGLEAQKAFTAGSISYKVVQIDGPQYLKSLIRGGKASVHTKGHLVNTELKMMNGMMHSQTITNHKTNTSYMLNDMMGDKTAVLLDDRTIGDTIKIKYYKKETKQILGYNCYKTILKSKEGTTTVYVTDEINAQSQLSRFYKELKGFPLEYEVFKDGVTITFQASAINYDAPPDSKFQIPEDYKQMTMAEFESMMGAPIGE